MLSKAFSHICKYTTPSPCITYTYSTEDEEFIAEKSYCTKDILIYIFIGYTYKCKRCIQCITLNKLIQN